MVEHNDIDIREGEGFWITLYRSTRALGGGDIIVLGLLLALVMFLLTLWLQGARWYSFIPMVESTELEPSLFPTLILTGLLLGAWAESLFRASQGLERSGDQLIPVRFDAVLSILPSMILPACCFLIVALVKPYHAPVLGCLWIAIPFLLFSFIRLSHRVTRFTFDYATQQTERATRAAREAAEARMDALRAQMNPRFLFDALDTVAVLARDDPATAERTVEDLSIVLRGSLDHGSRARASLGEELALIKAYLAVERIRRVDRLEIELSIDSDHEAAIIPSMTLQTLVEQAFGDGIAAPDVAARLTISSERVEDRLLITVAVHGIECPIRSEAESGFAGLRTRLETMYGDAATVFLESGEGARVARIELPYSTPNA